MQNVSDLFGAKIEIGTWLYRPRLSRICLIYWGQYNQVPIPAMRGSLLILGQTL
jgi:uncharacterized protein YPO0396